MTAAAGHLSVALPAGVFLAGQVFAVDGSETLVRLSPGKTRQQENLSAFWQFLRPGVPIDRPVDGYGDAAVDQGLYAGILFSQLPEQLPYVLGLDLDLVLASGGRAKRSPERHFDHQPARFVSIAARMRGGDIGIWVIRTPAAFDTALAIAASGGTIDVSPTPRTP